MFHQKKILDVLFAAKKAQDERWEVMVSQSVRYKRGFVVKECFTSSSVRL
jgi:hypothetical protein